MMLIGVTVRMETMNPLTLRVEIRAVYTKRRWWIASYLINWGLHPISGVTRLVYSESKLFYQRDMASDIAPLTQCKWALIMVTLVVHSHRVRDPDLYVQIAHITLKTHL